ncbi:DUF1707 SHOCT-like domain-containing protein [Jatrophihabitans sp. DSM 45814]
MTAPQEPVRIRIGDADRDAALKSLGEHMRAGRLDPDEYSERAEKVSVARYTDELAPLFSDLPSGAPAFAQSPAASGRAPAPATRQSDGFVDRNGGRLMAITGPVCTLLFFVCGFLGGWAWSWVFFLVPGLVFGIIRGEDRHDRDRNR